MFDAVLGHDLSFFDRYPTGGIVSRVLSDTQAFSEVVTLTIEVVSEIVLAALIFAYLFTIDVPLTLIALLMVPGDLLRGARIPAPLPPRGYPVAPLGSRRQRSRA